MLTRLGAGRVRSLFYCKTIYLHVASHSVIDILHSHRSEVQMNKMIMASMIFFLSALYADAGIRGIPMNPSKYVGNVSGSVLDAATGKPIAGAEVYLLAPNSDPTAGMEKVDKDLVSSTSHFRPRAATNDSGGFLINFVPTPDSGQSYELVVKASGYQQVLVRKFMVPPGALFSPTFTISLRNGMSGVNVVPENRLASMVKYGTPQYVNRAQLTPERSKGSKSKLDRVSTVGVWIYATREGDLGLTTANGHVIQTNDFFCALPDHSVLNSSDQSTVFNVTLYYGSTVETDVPVWDVGPLNWHDNYWDPESQRRIYQYLTHGGEPGLAQYVPEAQEAYWEGYNDGYGEPVPPHHPNGYDIADSASPAGIDLADGAFLILA